MESRFLRAGQLLCRRESSTAAAANFRSVLNHELEGIRAAGTWKVERVITTPQAAAIQVQEKEGSILNFCANNYLGLSVSNPSPTTPCSHNRDLPQQAFYKA